MPVRPGEPAHTHREGTVSTRRGAVAPEPLRTCPGNLPTQPMESYSLQLQLPRWMEPMDPFALRPVQPTVYAEQGQRPRLKEAGLPRGTGLRAAGPQDCTPGKPSCHRDHPTPPHLPRQRSSRGCYLVASGHRPPTRTLLHPPQRWGRLSEGGRAAESPASKNQGEKSGRLAPIPELGCRGKSPDP